MAERVDLNNIKTQIKSVFDTANTVGALPIDLSANLSTRVQKVLTVHPDMIPLQASFWPFVTCYIDSKEINSDDISVNQQQSKRRARLKIVIVGGFYNENFVTDTKDPADEDINLLMENIELVLRGSHDLNASVKWQKPTDVQYYISPLNQKTHVRLGLLTLDAQVFY